jgi:hypothetical protein
MRLLHSESTCSMAELCGLDWFTKEEVKEEVQTHLARAKEDSRRMIIANLDHDQHLDIGKIMRAAGFRCVGTYPGNSTSSVHVYIHGLRKARARKSR